MKTLLTANWVFDLADANNGEVHAIYRCNLCQSLVESALVMDHFAWHETLLHAPQDGLSGPARRGGHSG